MKYVICKNMDEFAALDKHAVEVWNETFPSGKCESYATPLIHPRDGRIAFPCSDLLPIDYETAQVLDKSWTMTEADFIKSGYDAFIQKGFDTGLGFKLAVSEDAQTKMSNLMTGLKNKGPANTSKWTLKDITGVKVEVTYEQFKDLANAYFDYVYGAWRQV